MSKRSDVCEGCIKETLENILGSKSEKFLLVQSSRKHVVLQDYINILICFIHTKADSVTQVQRKRLVRCYTNSNGGYF